MKVKKREFVKLAEPAKGKGKYYLTNKDLMPAIIEAKEMGKFTDKLARMLMLLADRYSQRSNFIGYSYREDMVAEAILNLAKNWHKFDETKWDNPFAFYTTAIRNSFLQYMNKETEQRYVRDTILVDNGLEPSLNFSGYLNEKEKRKALLEQDAIKMEKLRNKVLKDPKLKNKLGKMSLEDYLIEKMYPDNNKESNERKSVLQEEIQNIKEGKGVIKNNILEF